MTSQRGFTLIELAIVLVIITILIGGLAMPLSAQIQARRIAETNKTLEEAREAIIGYAMSNSITNTCNCKYVNGTYNSTDCPSAASCTAIAPPPAGDTTLTLTIPTRHYLPCPDKPDDGDPATTDDGDGVEDRVVAGGCAQSPGYLPWVTLGTANQDAWGNRLQYAVTAAFADSSTGFSNTDSGTLQVCSASGCATVNVASDVPMVLASYGPNGWGARNVNGNTLNPPTSPDELENTNNDSNFISRTPSKAGDAAVEFDDLVKWISADQLRGRVCPDGGCP
jgi:prepilin-type N-terminal cleavage/methylation domain-containing protein